MRPEPFDPATGEVLPSVERAADGLPIPTQTKSAGNVLDMLEDGRFSAEAYHQIKELGRFLGERAKMTEKPQKGKVTITIDMEADGDSFRMQPKIAIKKPEVARPRSVAWQDDRGNFTRFPPNQLQMYGVRDADDEPRAAPRSI